MAEEKPTARASTPRRLLFASLYLAALVALAEGAAQVAHRVTHGGWLLAGYPGEEIHSAFRRHPHLVGVPRAGFARTEGDVRLSHNSLGQRGPEIARAKPPGVVRIAAVGGSTTYCAGVSDEETWPVRLGEILGPGYEVVNLGVPGYSSAENVIQTAFQLADLDVDVALFYVGWNDVRNSHVRNLDPDYANFHATHLYWSLGLFHLRTGNRSALVFYLRRALGAVFVEDPFGTVKFRPTADRLTANVDRRLLGLYRRNLASLVALARAHGSVPVLIPQVLNFEAMAGDEPGRWVPMIRERDIVPVMGAFNDALLETAARRGAASIPEVLDAGFGAGDFLDHGHFSAAGNRKFAEIVAAAVRRARTGAARPRPEGR